MKKCLLILSILCLLVWHTNAEASRKRVIVTLGGSLGVLSQRSTIMNTLSDSIQAQSIPMIKELPLSGAVVVLASPDEISRLKKSFGGGITIEEDIIYSVSPLQTSSFSQSEISAMAVTQTIDYGVRRIGSFAGSSRGEGVVVCVSDTGIDLVHPDLRGNIIANFNTIDPNKSGQDDNRHGTHVAGTIAALNNSIGVVGVAPKAKLIAAKGLAANGSGNASDLVETIDGCVSRGAHVINMSWGGDSPTPIIEDALQRAAAAGVVLIAAAGNSSTQTTIAPVGYPARYPTVIAVSAVDSTDRVAVFSNQGSEIAFAAPGVGILSTLLNGTYGPLSGTSMASPHVAGVVGLYLSKNPGATRAEVLAGLGASSIGLAATAQGRGLISSVLSTR